MIPLTVDVEQMQNYVPAVEEAVQEKLGVIVPYKFGSMVETPRAALTAGKITLESYFFSLRTNDLTQVTYDFSCDDA